MVDSSITGLNRGGGRDLKESRVEEKPSQHPWDEREGGEEWEVGQKGTRNEGSPSRY